MQHPSDLTHEQRLEEIAGILALAIHRTRLKNLDKTSEKMLEFAPNRSKMRQTEKGVTP